LIFKKFPDVAREPKFRIKEVIIPDFPYQTGYVGRH